MSIHDHDTMKMERASLPSAPPPAQDSVRGVFLAIDIVAVFAFLCGLELWRIALALMVTQVLVR